MLLFSFDYPPLGGGIARLSSGLARTASRSGVPMAVLTQRIDGPSNGWAADRVPEIRVTNRRPAREAAAFSRMRAVASNGPVVCGAWYPEGLIAVLAGARPLVVLAHGAELFGGEASVPAALRAALRRPVLRTADLVVANSRYTRRLLGEHAPGARVAVVEPSVDHDHFCPGDRALSRRRWRIEDRRLVVSSVSRLEAYKGHEVVFRALAALPGAVRQRYLYLIAGEGRDAARLRGKAEQLGVDARLRWLGHVDEERLPDLYRASDLFVQCTSEQPSERKAEGFGIALLEAQACATPVVGTRSGGIPEAIDESATGWLIAEGDAPALSDLLLRLAREPRLFRRAGHAGRSRVEERYTWDRYLERFAGALASRGIALA